MASNVYVIEVNPRASRTVPYVSKATGVPLAKIAARLMTGRKLREFLPEFIERGADLDTGHCYYVKSPVFPWNKFPGVDTVLGPEMKSTGEVMGVADNFGEAFAKAQTAAGQKLPTQGTVFISVNDHDKPGVAEVSRKFVDMGFKLVATAGTADVIEARWHDRRAGLQSERRTTQRCGSHQGRAHSPDRQYAARGRSLVRREGDPARGGAGADSYDYDACRRLAQPRKASPRCSAASCGSRHCSTCMRSVQ